MIELRPYQLNAIARIREASARVRAVLCVSPTGSGKTTIASEIVRRTVDRGRKALWLAHRTELIDQAYDRLREFGLSVGTLSASVSPTRPPNPFAPVQVASIQTLIARKLRPQADVVIWDECFVAGTLVDGRPIETIRAGDMVTAFDETTGAFSKRRVVRTMRREATRLVKVIVGSVEIVCTPEHPFWTSRGWVFAKDLENESVRMWSRDLPQVEKVSFVLPPRNGGKESERRPTRIHASQEPDEERSVAQEVERDVAPDWTSSDCPRGKRSTCACPGRDGFLCCPWACSGVPCGDGLAEQKERRNACLQGGLGYAGDSPGDRDRRAVTWPIGQTTGGHEEVGRSEWARVDRVEVFKSGSDKQFAGVHTDTAVYNLEVEELHTYTANGVVVHNCHHSPSDLWSGIAADYSAAHIIGFTATPERSDGRGLGNVFQRLVVAASVRELVDLGHLVPCEIMRPESKLRPGSIAQRPVDAYLKHAQGRKTICFSPSIVAAEIHLDEFKQAGIRARLVHSKLPVAERIQSLDDFRSGRVDVLLNVYVLTEGFDVPATDCVILARGCGTAGTYLQMVGRGLRPAPGKQDCLLVDLHGVSHVHGKPDDDRQYSLDGRGIRSANELVVDGQSSCRVCGAPIVSGEACPECGAEPKQITPPKVTGEQLVPYASKRAESDDKRVATLARWIAEGRSRGFKPNWAHVKFKAVYGLYPPGHIQNQALEQLRSRDAVNDGERSSRRPASGEP